MRMVRDKKELFLVKVETHTLEVIKIIKNGTEQCIIKKMMKS